MKPKIEIVITGEPGSGRVGIADIISTVLAMTSYENVKVVMLKNDNWKITATKKLS